MKPESSRFPFVGEMLSGFFSYDRKIPCLSYEKTADRDVTEMECPVS